MPSCRRRCHVLSAVHLHPHHTKQIKTCLPFVSDALGGEIDEAGIWSGSSAGNIGGYCCGSVRLKVRSVRAGVSACEIDI